MCFFQLFLFYLWALISGRWKKRKRVQLSRTQRRFFSLSPLIHFAFCVRTRAASQPSGGRDILCHRWSYKLFQRHNQIRARLIRRATKFKYTGNKKSSTPGTSWRASIDLHCKTKGSNAPSCCCCALKPPRSLFRKQTTASIGNIKLSETENVEPLVAICISLRRPSTLELTPRKQSNQSAKISFSTQKFPCTVRNERAICTSAHTIY